MILLFVKFDFDQHVWHWVQHGGPFMLFALLFSCGLGMPLPEDIPLLAAGAMVRAGQMHLAVAAICAWCGIIGGDCVLYHLGKAFGTEVTRIPFIGNHLRQERMQRVERMFERWGVWVVAVGRLFAGIRGAMVVVAGATRFNFIKFIIADGIAAIGSGGMFLYLGYYFGGKIQELNAHVHEAKKWMLIGAAALVVVIVAYIWIRSRRANAHGFPVEVTPEPRVAPTATPLSQETD
jgi:membrane protein DedA with SNARE-associated domain